MRARAPCTFITALDQRRSSSSALSERYPQLSYLPHISSTSGRLTYRQIKRLYRAEPEAHFYLCGPPSYISWVESALNDLGVPEARVHQERFTFYELDSPVLYEQSAAHRAQISVLGWLGVGAYLLQDQLELSWLGFRAWQAQEAPRLWSGVACLCFILTLWSLSLSQNKSARKSHKKLRYHKWLGAVAPLALFSHAT